MIGTEQLRRLPIGQPQCLHTSNQACARRRILLFSGKHTPKLNFKIEADQVKKYNIEDFSARLASELKSSGLKQADIAARLDVSEGSVSGWIKGTSKPYRKTVDALAALLGVRAEWLREGRTPRAATEQMVEEAAPGTIPPASPAAAPGDQAAIAQELRSIASSLERLAKIIHPQA